jgi:glutamate-1-semialdehyde 2,1-aminomutase
MYHIGSIFWTIFNNNDEIRASGDIDIPSLAYFKKFHYALLELGVYLGPSEYEVGFVSSAHTDEDIEATVKAMRQARAIAMTK